jgi:hypothetical protein
MQVHQTKEPDMSNFAEVEHHIWIAAPLPTVRSQFGDLDHHVRNNVHPKLRFEALERGAGYMRFMQEMRLLGLKQRDIFERQWLPDGNMRDTSIEGFNKGGTLDFNFTESARGGHAGTEVGITIRLPVPPLLEWLAPLLQSQVRREVKAAAFEDKYDLEQRGYQPAS